MKTKNSKYLLTLLLSLSCVGIHAQTATEAAAAAQANNPLADMKAFNIQNYYIGEVTGPVDDGNQLWFRYAQPFSLGETDWLMRASLPVNSYSDPVDDFGLGDFNIFGAYLFENANPAISVGLGPQLTVPTASSSSLGSEKWSAGLAHVLFDASSPVLQWGYLLTWQTSFAGEEDRSDVNIAAFQPFLFYQLGEGHYLRAAPIWAYDIENIGYSIPIGFGYGKVFKRGDIVYNAFLEPQYSVADKGDGWPEWQLFFALNMQFAN